MTLEEGIARLLEQCDREDVNAPSRRYLYTSEIRSLLGVGPAPDYRELAEQIQNEGAR